MLCYAFQPQLKPKIVLDFIYYLQSIQIFAKNFIRNISLKLHYPVIFKFSFYYYYYILLYIITLQVGKLKHRRI